ncbi:MAG TPA: tRNA adenosine(34) deaminase TadA, partial [Psychrobacter sp.]|nr:tRNA adenosine(34) deaminase TadA [Psychrobacter sp.]
IIGEGFNQPILSCDPTSHAEIVALREACKGLQNYRLPPNTTLYVTLEPCTMCLGALIHARLARLVFATQEPRAGMVGSQLNLAEMDFYNHKIEVNSGLLQPESQKILKYFFKARRNKKKKK